MGDYLTFSKKKWEPWLCIITGPFIFNNRGDLPEPWVLDVSDEHGYQLGYPERHPGGVVAVLIPVPLWCTLHPLLHTRQKLGLVPQYHQGQTGIGYKGLGSRV